MDSTVHTDCMYDLCRKETKVVDLHQQTFLALHIRVFFKCASKCWNEILRPPPPPPPQWKMAYIICQLCQHMGPRSSMLVLEKYQARNAGTRLSGPSPCAWHATDQVPKALQGILHGLVMWRLNCFLEKRHDHPQSQDLDLQHQLLQGGPEHLRQLELRHFVVSEFREDVEAVASLNPGS